MAIIVNDVKKNSLAYKANIQKQDEIISINGNEVFDVLDLMFFSTEMKLQLVIKRQNSTINIEIQKDDEYTDLGLDFKTYLIDEQHFCKNKCVFCFVDQLPKGLRESLYFKDDDERLSFLFGNYITLTNLSQREKERIKLLKISPINISVHTTNEDLRVRMMKNKKAGEINEIMKEFSDSGITMNTQIVLCRNLNDGKELEKTIKDLQSLYPSVQSVAIVPIGITRYRENLEKLEVFDEKTAGEVIDKVEELTKDFNEKHGKRITYLSDEFFFLAKREIPDTKYYGDFAQIENGVGMTRQFLDGFFDEVDYLGLENKKVIADIATGMAMYPLLKDVFAKINKDYPEINVKVHGIKNDFFGGNVWVTGLIVAKDLINQLEGNLISDTLYLCDDMLRSEKDLFLDDKTPKDVQTALKVKTKFYKNDGYSLAQELFTQ